MEKTIKVDERAYAAIKALAKKRGQFLKYVINEALRKYVEANKNHDQA